MVPTVFAWRRGWCLKGSDGAWFKWTWRRRKREACGPDCLSLASGQSRAPGGSIWAGEPEGDQARLGRGVEPGRCRRRRLPGAPQTAQRRRRSGRTAQSLADQIPVTGQFEPFGRLRAACHRTKFCFARCAAGGGREESSELMRFEATQQTPFPLEEVIWGYQMLSSSETEVRSVCASARRCWPLCGSRMQMRR